MYASTRYIILFPMNRLCKFFPFLIVVLGFWLWSGALEAGFALDDRMYILNNLALRTLDGTPLSDPRFIGFLSFALNYVVGGLNAFDYHLFNLLIHLANSLLIFYILKASFIRPQKVGPAGTEPPDTDKISVQATFAFVTALIFMAHPVQAQAVTYLSQRFASLAALFYLAALLLFIKGRLLDMSEESKGGKLYYLFCVVSTLLAMKTKEIAFTLPFALLLYDMIFYKGIRRSMGVYIPLALTLLIIPVSLLLDSSTLGGTGLVSEVTRVKLLEASSISKTTYLFTEFSVIAYYIKLLFYPSNLRFYYDFPVSDTLFNLRTILSLLFLLFVLFTGALTLKRSLKPSTGEEPKSINTYGLIAAFGIFFFFLALSTESSVIPIKDVIFEHRLYLPSFGLIIAFTSGLCYLSLKVFRGGRQRVAIAAACLLLCLAVVPLGAVLKVRNNIWKDPLVFINDNIGKSPNLAHLYYIRGLIYIERGMLEESIADNTLAIELDPTHFQAFNNRGTAYLRSGLNKKGLNDLTHALKINPEHFDSLTNRALAHARMSHAELALLDLKSAYELDSDKTRHIYSEWISADLAPACDKARTNRPGGCSIIELLEQGEQG